MVVTNEELLEAIRDNIKETKEIKATMDSIVSALKTALEDISNLNSKCELLENKNIMLENEIKFLKRQLRINNFILHKVPENEVRDHEDILKTVKTVCEAAEIILPDSAINKCFRIGKSSKERPILVSLNSKLIKDEIMKKKEVFFRNNTPISQDRSPEERQFGRRIFNCMNYLRKIDKNATYFKNKFKCRSVLYSLEEVENLINGPSPTSDKKENLKKIKSGTAEKLSEFRFREKQDSC